MRYRLGRIQIPTVVIVVLYFRVVVVYDSTRVSISCESILGKPDLHTPPSAKLRAALFDLYMQEKNPAHTAHE